MARIVLTKSEVAALRARARGRHLEGMRRRLCDRFDTRDDVALYFDANLPDAQRLEAITDREIEALMAIGLMADRPVRQTPIFSRAHERQRWYGRKLAILAEEERLAGMRA